MVMNGVYYPTIHTDAGEPWPREDLGCGSRRPVCAPRPAPATTAAWHRVAIRRAIACRTLGDTAEMNDPMMAEVLRGHAPGSTVDRITTPRR